MNIKQKINLAVWTLIVSATFGVLFWSLLEETPQGIWARQSVLNIYLSRGMLAFITASTFYVPL